jgi:hypothetical protein
MKKFLFFLPAVLLLVAALPAKADPVIPLSPELKAFLLRPEQQQGVVNLMFAQWNALVGDCPSPSAKLVRSNVLTEKPPSFDASGTPTAGEWRVVGRIEGCGVARTFNILYAFTKDGAMKRLALLPGSTAANPVLQHDGLMYAAMGMANLAPKGCKDIKYTDTRFLGFDDGNTADTRPRPWTEEWTVRACGVSGVVTMHFAPNATNNVTDIVTDLSKTRRVQE